MPAELGQKRLAAEVEVRLVNHDGDVGRGASNDFAHRVARNQLPGRIVRIGQKDDARPIRDGVADLARRELEAGLRIDGDHAATGRFDEHGVHFEGRHRHDRFEQSARVAVHPERAHRQGPETFVQSVGQRKLRLCDAQVCGAFAHERAVVRIVRDVFGGNLPDRVDDGLRTAAGVLVQVQPQGTLPIAGPHVGHRATSVTRRRRPRRTSIDRACASSPSSRASVMTVDARFFSPWRVIR